MGGVAGLVLLIIIIVACYCTYRKVKAAEECKYLNLLPTGSEEREVFGVGSMPSCQDMKLLHYN